MANEAEAKESQRSAPNSVTVELGHAKVTKDTTTTTPRIEQADFETAIDASGFGLFNVLLMLVALPSAMTTVFETSTMSYILPSAECDLKLSLLDKGVLNAITYAGMISSALLWGYVADTKGRKMLLVYGFMADVVCVLGGAFSQNVVQLMVFKFLGGFITGGPFAILMTYLTELHGRLYRARVMMMIGIMFSLSSLILPVLALTILPQQWDIQIVGLQLHSWQVFLATTAVPPALSCLFLMFFPESPKFLMSQGRNDEAMEAFKKIYRINKRMNADSYPIKALVNEVPERVKKPTTAKLAEALPEKGEAMSSDGTTCKATTTLSEGLRQLRPLFVKPYLGLSLWVYLLNFCVLLGHNTMRLWLPQLFASITEYEQLQQATSGTGESVSTTMCSILEYSVNRTTSAQANAGGFNCEVNITAASYTNNIIVALASLFAYMIAGFLVNLVGVKCILTLGLFICGICGIALYWSSSSMMTVAIASISITMGSLSSTSVISATVGLFPTQLRTMMVSLEMMVGRFGSLLGNVFFPALMSFGCIPPFLMVAFFMFCASLLASFLPIKNKEALK